MKKALGVTARPCSVQDEKIQKDYHDLSDKCQLAGHSVNLLQFMSNRIRAKQASFTHIEALNVDPIKAILSAKVTPYVCGSMRFFLTLYEESVSNLLSMFFDKVVVDAGSNHFEWTRGTDSLECDGLEYVIRNPESPLLVSIALYPDFPVPFFIVPDHLRQITGKDVDFFAHIMQTITRYAAEKSLIIANDIVCDEVLQAAFNCPSIPMSQLPHVLNSILLPVQPIFLDFVLTQESPVKSVLISLPNLSRLPLAAPVENPDIARAASSFAREWERVELYAALARNPYEALEAEIAGHATMCELTDETSGTAPTQSIDPMNPARRSTPFYWKAWVSDHASRFLEENKIVQGKYTEEKKRARK